MRLVNPGFCSWFSGSYSVFFFPLLMNFEFRVINIGAVETKQGNNCFLLFVYLPFGDIKFGAHQSVKAAHLHLIRMWNM